MIQHLLSFPSTHNDGFYNGGYVLMIAVVILVVLLVLPRKRGR